MTYLMLPNVGAMVDVHGVDFLAPAYVDVNVDRERPLVVSDPLR